MFVDYKNKIIVSKSFKTASSSFYKVIQKGVNHNRYRLFNNHRTIKGIVASFNLKYEDYTKITLVRNPWDYMVSAYFWAIKNNECPSGYNFEDFVFKKSSFNWTKQKMYWDLDYIDRVIIYEDFEFQCKAFCREYGFKYTRPEKVKNNSRPFNTNYTDIHTERTKKYVENYFKDIIDKYDYRY